MYTCRSIFRQTFILIVSSFLWRQVIMNTVLNFVRNRGDKNAEYLTPNVSGIVSFYNRNKNKKDFNFGSIMIPGDIRDNDKICLWEMGGKSNKAAGGNVMLVAHPGGEIIDRPISFNKNAAPNGRQGLAAVWEDCLVSIGELKRGVSTALLFRIVEINDGSEFGFSEKVMKNNVAVILEFIGYCTKNWRLTYPQYDEMYHPFMTATLNKLQIKNCMTAVYMNPWAYCNKMHKSFKPQFDLADITLLRDRTPTTTASVQDMLDAIRSKLRTLKIKRYVPIRQYISKAEDGYDITMIVIRPTAEGETVEADQYIIGYYTTRITKTSDAVNVLDRAAFMKASSYATFTKAVNGRDVVDNWLIYKN